jgi:hypothetical protein
MKELNKLNEELDKHAITINKLVYDNEKIEEDNKMLKNLSSKNVDKSEIISSLCFLILSSSLLLDSLSPLVVNSSFFLSSIYSSNDVFSLNLSFNSFCKNGILTCSSS